MQTKNIVYSICLLFFFTQLAAAQSFQTVKAFKPGKELVQNLKALKLQGIKIAGDGTTSPDRGYKMAYSRTAGKFYILPSKLKLSNLKEAADGKDLGGGVFLRCIGCTDCKVTEASGAGGRKVYGCSYNKCQNSAAGCNASVVVEKKEVTSYLEGDNWTRL